MRATLSHKVFAELLPGRWVLPPAAGQATPALVNGPRRPGRFCCVWLLLLVSSCSTSSHLCNGNFVKRCQQGLWDGSLDGDAIDTVYPEHQVLFSLLLWIWIEGRGRLLFGCFSHDTITAKSQHWYRSRKLANTAPRRLFKNGFAKTSVIKDK